jgi:hypothetical protein
MASAITHPPMKTVAPPATASASAIRQWLRPATLRSQFILTELLRPPVGLRDPDEL